MSTVKSWCWRIATPRAPGLLFSKKNWKIHLLNGCFNWMLNQTLTHRNWVVTPICNTKKNRFGDLANSEHKNINKIVPIVGGVTIGGQESFSMIYMFKKMLASLNLTKNIHLKLLVWSSRYTIKISTEKTTQKTAKIFQGSPKPPSFFGLAANC